ncbi:hypothetical protein NL529_33780, partial [Klebsiella pneumoniae]|nr:hypothetical protein [Klebsiella pneumoniae]
VSPVYLKGLWLMCGSQIGMRGKFVAKSPNCLDRFMLVWFSLMILDKLVFLGINPPFGATIYAALAGIFVVALIAGCSL